MFRSAPVASLAALLLASAAGTAIAAAESAAAPAGWTHAVGFDVEPSDLEGLGEKAHAAGAAGQGILIWSSLDLEDAYAQDPALSSLEQVLAPLVEAGLRPGLTLHFSGRSLPGPNEPERMKSWEEALERLARLGAREVAATALALPESPDTAERSVTEVAYLAKRTSVALRTVRRDLPVMLETGADPQPWLEPLLREDVGPYVDGVILEAPEGADAKWVERTFASVFQLRPGLRVLTRGWPADAAAATLDIYLRAVSAGASAVLFRPPAPAQESAVWAILGCLRAQIPDSFPPADAAPLRFVGPDGKELPVVHGRFFNPQTFDAVVWYRPESPDAPKLAGVALGTADAINPVVFNPVTGQERAVSPWIPDRKARTTAFNLPLRSHSMLLRYHHEIKLTGERSDLKVETERIPPVEEILARYQEFQAAQDRRLHRWIADAVIGLHYTLGSSVSAFDLTYRSTLYADPEGATEWEHRSLEINGSPYRSQKLPDLPYVLPERVVQVPLRLTLNKDYTYRLAGSDTLDGAKVWVVEFEPVDPNRNLYHGRVWIDAATYARRRLSAVQTHVETPTLSVEDELEFEPVPGEQEPLWVLKRSRGQQVITVSGRNLVLVRKIEFSNVRINPPDFEAQRAAALASPHFIVRESAEGYQTLDRKEDGTRVPRPSGVQKTLFVLGGVFYNRSVPFPVPLAGVNYFNFKTRGRDLHLEVLAAGAFNFVNLTDPKFLGSKWEVGADLTTRAFPLRDRFVRTEAEGERIDQFGVDDIAQSLSLIAARQTGPYIKLSGFYDLGYDRYSRDHDTPAIFVTPSDTFTQSVEGRVEFDRKAASVQAFGRLSRRGTWKPWGFPTASVPTLGPEATTPGFGQGSLLEEFDAKSRDYAQYGLSLARLWTPGAFHTVRAEVTWLQGADLDRFSKFSISTLGEVRVRGFGGSGVRFDQGGMARAVYTFKAGPLLRLDASVDQARVRERDIGEGRFLDFTGLGLAGNFSLQGGWVVRLDYGIGISSSLKDLEGGQEVLLQLLKIL